MQLVPPMLARAAASAIDFRMPEPTAVVYIIDDDESTRETLRSMLRSVDLAARAHATVDDFLATPRPDAPGCLVLDVRLPGISGLDLQGRLSGLGIYLPVIL